MEKKFPPLIIAHYFQPHSTCTPAAKASVLPSELSENELRIRIARVESCTALHCYRSFSTSVYRFWPWQFQTFFNRKNRTCTQQLHHHDGFSQTASKNQTLELDDDFNFQCSRRSALGGGKKFEIVYFSTIPTSKIHSTSIGCFAIVSASHVISHTTIQLQSSPGSQAANIRKRGGNKSCTR